MFNAALQAVLRSPTSFFDTTPIGTYPPIVFILSIFIHLTLLHLVRPDALPLVQGPGYARYRTGNDNGPSKRYPLPLTAVVKADLLTLYPVPQHVQLRFRNDRSCVLHFPLPRNNICTPHNPLFPHIQVLQSYLGGDQEAGFRVEVDPLCIILRYANSIAIGTPGEILMTQ